MKLSIKIYIGGIHMAKMNKKWVVLCSTAIGAIYAAGYFATETQATMLLARPQDQVYTQTESSQPQQQAQAPTPTESSQPQQQAQAPTPTVSSQPQQQAQAPTPTKSSQSQQQTQVPTPTKSSQPQQQVPVPTPTKSSQPQQQVPIPTPTKSSQPQQQAPVPTPTKSSQPQQQAPVPTPTKSSQVYKDGTYNGSGSNRRGSIQVAVTIKSDKITDVAISHFAMHYTIDDVVGLPQEVVQKQSAQVKNVSGATYSTQAFQDAVQVALSQAKNS
jgi:uncharacterized protein with FMN-binding domain